MPILSNIVEFARKSLSARQLKFMVARNILSRIPPIREKYACYGDSILIDEAASRKVLSEDFLERIPLSQIEVEYYRKYKKDICCPTEGDVLIARSSIDIYEINDCEILPKSLAVLHSRSRRIILGDGQEIGRNHLSPFAYKDSVRVPGRAISLMSTPRGHSHYFHFLFDLLKPLIWHCRRSADNGNIKVLVRETLAPHQRFALSAVTAAYPHLEIQPMPDDVRISCECLLVPEVRGGFAAQHLGDRDTLLKIRELLLDHLTAEQGPTDAARLFISRKNQKTRRLVNEEEVLRLLSPIGVESVLPETLPFEAQMRLFSSTATVIAACGAALTNMLFCRPGSMVIEFCPADIHIPYWIVLAKQMGLDHYFVPGSAGGVYQAFSVDADALLRTVQQGHEHSNRTNAD